jgi:hypothetical protein
MSISSRIERVRAEDLLDDSEPTERAVRRGVSGRRQLAGLALGVLGLPLLTLLLDTARGSLSLESVVLLYLLAVVALAVVGGVVIAVLGAVAAAVLINFFFVEPRHTLDIAHGQQALALGVFVAVAIVVSGLVELAARRARAPSRPPSRRRRCRRSPAATSTSPARSRTYSTVPARRSTWNRWSSRPAITTTSPGATSSAPAGLPPAARRRCASTFRSTRGCGSSVAARRSSPKTSGCWVRSPPPPRPPMRAAG